MAGAIANRFVEAIEWVLAHDIVQTARNRPHHLVFYVYHHDDLMGKPLAMVSKYEPDITDDQFKVRIWDADIDDWQWVDPIFSSRVRAAAFIARYHAPDPCRALGIGVKQYVDTPRIRPVHMRRLRMTSGPLDWLMETEAMLEDYMDDYGDHEAAIQDRHEMGNWVEDKDRFLELLEDQIDFLITIMF